MTKILSKLFLAMSMLAFLATSSLAQEQLESWYQALSPVDRNMISTLLADDAEIDLQDLEIIQTKDEFIDALDYWEEAIEGGSISYEIDMNKVDGMYRATVCYQFSSNQMFTEELFVIEDGLIKRSVQKTLSADCKS